MAGNLAAEVEGDIEEVDDVLKITTIRIHYSLKAAEESLRHPVRPRGPPRSGP